MFHFDSKNPPNRPRLRQYVLSRAIVAITILGLGTTVARAQFRASIQGTVTDPQGEVIPGATLTLTDIDTNHPITAISNGSGVYNFNALAPDHYNMTVTAKGFKEQVIQDLHIIPEQPNSVDVRLELGEASTSVTVSGDAIAPLETATASTSGVVNSNQIQHLPSAGRDVFQLAQLAPGVFGDGSPPAPEAPPAAQASFKLKTIRRSSQTARRTPATASASTASAPSAPSGAEPPSSHPTKTP